MLSRKIEKYVLILLSVLFFVLICTLFVGCDDRGLGGVFASEDFSITFVLDNGEENIVWRKGDDVPLPQKDGFYFDGWYCEKECENKFIIDFDDPKLLSDIVVYAKWRNLEIFSGIVFEDLTVTYDGNPHAILASNIPDGAEINYLTAAEYTEAGVYEIVAEIKKYGYRDLHISATLTIEKAKIEGVVFEGRSVEWDGEPHSIYACGVPEGVTVNYRNNEQTETGVYEVIASFNVGNNYLPLDDMRAELRIKDKLCKVTFLNGDGTSAVIDVVYGEIADDVPELFYRAGYTSQWDKDILQNIYSDTTFSAIYLPVTYDIQLVFNGADIDDATITYTIESEDLTLIQPERRQYDFGGWYDNVLLEGERIVKIPVGSYGNKKLYAKWIPIEYGISYDLIYNDATNDINNPRSFNAESGVIVFNAPVRANSEFAGWYLADTGEAITQLDASEFDHSITLKATWKSIEYNVLYLLNGGINSEDNPDRFTADCCVELQNATRPYYDFIGWFDELGRKTERIAGVACDLTLTARWAPSCFQIYYFGLEDAEQHEDNPNVYNIESPDLPILAPTREHFVFEGWYLDEEFGGNKVDVIPTGSHGNTCLYAKWSAVSYSICYNGQDADAADNPAAYTVEDEDIVLINPFRTGYVFDGWFLDGQKITVLQTDGGDKILSAKWIKIQYKINYQSGDDAQNDGRNVNSFFIDDGIIPLYAPVRPHYTFVGWMNGDTDEFITQISSSCGKDINAVAVWEETVYHIFYDTDGGSFVDDDYVVGYTHFSEDIRLPDLQKRGYEFIGWYDNPLFEGETKDVVCKGGDGDKYFYAAFRPIKYKVILIYKGGERTIEYDIECEDIVLSDPPQEVGYNFSGWYDAEGEKAYEIYTANVCDLTLYAKYSAIDYSITYIVDGSEIQSEPSVYSVENPVAFPIPESSDLKFDGWYMNSECAGERIENTCGFSKNLTVYGRWSVVFYSVEYILDGGENSLSNPLGFTSYDGVRELYPPTKRGYEFVCWMDVHNGERVDAISSSSKRNITLKAVWSPIKYCVSYALDGGINSSANPDVYTIEDCPLKLDNAYKNGYEFLGWYRMTDGEKVSLTHIDVYDDVNGVLDLFAEFAPLSQFSYERLNETYYVITEYLGNDCEVSVPSYIDGHRISAIGASVFEKSARSITRLEISEGIVEIEAGAFANMIALDTLIIPSTIKNMPDALLSDCSSLRDLTIPYVGDQKYISGEANKAVKNFSHLFSSSAAYAKKEGFATVERYTLQTDACGAESAVVDGSFAFVPETLTNVTVLGGDIFARAFYGCTTIRSLRFEGEGTSVGSQAMRGCVNLKEVSFSDGFENFDSYMFYKCDNIEKIVVGSESQKTAIQVLKDAKRIPADVLIEIADM